MFSRKVFCGATSPLFPPGIAAARASAKNRFALHARQADTDACGVKRRGGGARAHGNARALFPVSAVCSTLNKKEKKENNNIKVQLAPSPKLCVCVCLGGYAKGVTASGACARTYGAAGRSSDRAPVCERERAALLSRRFWKLLLTG